MRRRHRIDRCAGAGSPSMGLHLAHGGHHSPRRLAGTPGVTVVDIHRIMPKKTSRHDTYGNVSRCLQGESTGKPGRVSMHRVLAQGNSYPWLTQVYNSTK